MEKVKFIQCKRCGNLFGVVHDSGAVPVCCGEPMGELVANSVEAPGEKHIPVITRKGDTVTVTVASVPHPMMEEHYIQWIALEQGGRMQRIQLNPGEAPEAVFPVWGDSPVTAYEYCNLHGLWKAVQA